MIKTTNRRWAARVRLMLTAVFAGIAVWLFQHYQRQVAQLAVRSLDALGALVLANALSILLIAAIQMEVLSRVFWLRLPLREGVELTVASECQNMLLPLKGGAVFRSVYLRNVHGLAVGAFLLACAVHFLTGFLAIGLVGLVVSLSHLSSMLGGAYIAGYAGAAALAVFGLCIPGVVGRFLGCRVNYYEVLSVSSRVLKPGNLSALSLWNAALVVTYCVRIYCSFRTLGLRVQPGECLVAGTTILLLGTLNITPANLGVREGVLSAMMSFYGYSPAEGLVVSLLDRCVQVCILFPAAFYAHFRIASRVRANRP